MKYWVAALVFVVTCYSIETVVLRARVSEVERLGAMQAAHVTELVSRLNDVTEECRIQNQTLSVILQTVRLLTLSQKEAAMQRGQGL